jgi:molybdate transport system permease protein
VTSRLLRLFAWTAGALLLALLGLPLVALLVRTGPAALLAGLRSPLVLPALRVSLWSSLVAVAAVVLLGTPVAFWISRTEGRARRLVEVLVQLPVVLPPSVAGLAMLLAFGRRGVFGALLESWGVQVAFTPLAATLAEAFVAAPFFLLVASGAFRAVDVRLLQVSRTLGYTAEQTFLKVALPLALRGLVSGAALAWARALGEFGATLMFAGNLPGRTQTLPLAIYTALESDLEAAQALSVMLLGFAVVVLGLSRLLGASAPLAPGGRLG